MLTFKQKVYKWHTRNCNLSNDNNIRARMTELCEPIDKQIMMCDGKEDVLMMACAMLEKVKTILDSQIGEGARRIIIREANDR